MDPYQTEDEAIDAYLASPERQTLIQGAIMEYSRRLGMAKALWAIADPGDKPARARAVEWLEAQIDALTNRKGHYGHLHRA